MVSTGFNYNKKIRSTAQSFAMLRKFVLIDEEDQMKFYKFSFILVGIILHKVRIPSATMGNHNSECRTDKLDPFHL